MKITCEMVFEYENGELAAKVLEAVKVDNEGYVESSVRGSHLVSKIEEGDPRRLGNTLDDLLACVSVAEASLRETF